MAPNIRNKIRFRILVKFKLSHQKRPITAHKNQLFSNFNCVSQYSNLFEFFSIINHSDRRLTNCLLAFSRNEKWTVLFKNYANAQSRAQSNQVTGVPFELMKTFLKPCWKTWIFSPYIEKIQFLSLRIRKTVFLNEKRQKTRNYK